MLRFWPVWLPVPRRAWRIADRETGDHVRDGDGAALQFEDGPKLWREVNRLNQKDSAKVLKPASRKGKT